MKRTVLVAALVFCSGFFVYLGSKEKPVGVYQIVKKIIVYDGEGAGNRDTASGICPGIVRLKNGDLLASFYNREGMYTIRSKDNGMTWRKPQQVVWIGPESVIGMTVLRNGAILWPFYQVLTKEPCCEDRRIRAYVYRSTDNGLTWEGGDPISSPMREIITYGHIVELPDGRLLLPVWGSHRMGERWRAGTLESTDGGKTWGTYRQIGYDPKAGCRPDNGFNETSIAQLPDHTLLAILREQRVGTRDHTPEAGPCDHYTEPADHFYRAVSHDLGKTWSSPERLALIGTSPALHVLPDGTLLLGYRDAPQHKGDVDHYGLGVRISRDQGLTWSDELHLEDPRGLRYTEKLQPGYPDFVDLPDGDIFVIFYSSDIKNGAPSNYIVGNVLHRVR